MIFAKLKKWITVAIVAGIGIGIIPNNTNSYSSDCGSSRLGWTIIPQRDGEIHNIYKETTDSSELWLIVKPKQPMLGNPGIPDLMLVFSICFPGKVLESPQRSAELRVQVNRDFIPAFVPEPTLQITIDNDLFDLTGKDFRHWIEYPFGCSPGDCGAYSAVLVDLPTEMLNRFVLATKIKGTLSGIPFELTTEHGHRIGAFIQRIAGK